MVDFSCFCAAARIRQGSHKLSGKGSVAPYAACSRNRHASNQKAAGARLFAATAPTLLPVSQQQAVSEGARKVSGRSLHALLGALYQGDRVPMQQPESRQASYRVLCNAPPQPCPQNNITNDGVPAPVSHKSHVTLALTWAAL